MSVLLKPLIVIENVRSEFVFTENDALPCSDVGLSAANSDVFRLVSRDAAVNEFAAPAVRVTRWGPDAPAVMLKVSAPAVIANAFWLAVGVPVCVACVTPSES